MPVLELAPGVAERVAATESPQPGCSPSCAPSPTVADAAGAAGFVVVADRSPIPGNLGTILRSAEAAGVDAVVVTPGSVDVFNPKVVRASAGALFHVPVVAADLDAVRRGRAAARRHLVAPRARPHRGRLVRPVAIVAGSEAHGLADDAPVDEWVRIEHRGRAESLNVAMADHRAVLRGRPPPRAREVRRGYLLGELADLARNVRRPKGLP